MLSDSNCIFCKIARGELPSRKVYEDDEVLGFRDIRPQAPVHFMLIPKRHIDSLAHAENEAAMSRMMSAMEAKPTGDIDRDFVAMMART